MTAAGDRPGSRFAFNVGGGFVGVTHPEARARPATPSLGSLIEQIAARDYGTPPIRTVRREGEPDVEVVVVRLPLFRARRNASELDIRGNRIRQEHGKFSPLASVCTGWVSSSASSG